MNNSSRLIVISAIIVVAAIIAGTTAFVLLNRNEAPASSAGESGTATTSSSPASAAPAASTLTFGTTIAPPPPDAIKFAFAERLAGELTGLVPAESAVNVDPKGERKVVTINFPRTVSDDEVKKSLEKIQPVAENYYQTKGIITEVGRRTDDSLAMAAQPVGPFLPVMKLTEQWDVINGAAPQLTGLFNLGLLSPDAFGAYDFQERDAKACGEQIRKVKTDFKDSELGLGSHQMVLRFTKCNGSRVVVYGQPGKLEMKLDRLATITSTKDLIPADSTVVVEKDGTLIVETVDPPKPELEQQLAKTWDLEKVKVYQPKTDKKSN